MKKSKESTVECAVLLSFPNDIILFLFKEFIHPQFR